jgi:hypothetical protein
MRLPILALFCSALVLLAAACGGGNSGSDRLTQAEFQTKANHICRELNKQEQPDLSTNSKDAVDRNLSRIDSAIGQLKGLRPPADSDARFQELLKSFEQTAAFVRAHESVLIELTRQQQAKASDPRVIARYERLVRPFLRELQIAGADATALGLTDCANGLTGASSSNG